MSLFFVKRKKIKQEKSESAEYESEPSSISTKTSIDYRQISSSEQNLIKKYKPNKILELYSFVTDIDSDLDVKDLVRLIKDKDGFCVMLKGESGTGKSTILDVISKELDKTLVKFDSSNIESREEFMKELNLYTIQNCSHFIISIEDITSILKYSQETYTKLIELLKKKKLKIVISINNGMSNSIDKKYNELKNLSRVLILPKQNLKNKIKHIVSKETNVTLTFPQLEKLSSLIDSDFNQMYFILFGLILKIKLLPENKNYFESKSKFGLNSGSVFFNDEIFKNYIDNVYRKKVDYTIFELTHKSLTSDIYKNISNYQESPSVLPLMIQENFPLFQKESRPPFEKGNKKKTNSKKVKEIEVEDSELNSEISGFPEISSNQTSKETFVPDIISNADLLHRSIFKTSLLDFHDIYACMSVSTPVFYLDQTKTEQLKQDNISFTSFLQKTSVISNRTKLMNSTFLDNDSIQYINLQLNLLLKQKKYQEINDLLSGYIGVEKITFFKLAKIKLTAKLKKEFGLS